MFFESASQFEVNLPCLSVGTFNKEKALVATSRRWVSGFPGSERWPGDAASSCPAVPALTHPGPHPQAAPRTRTASTKMGSTAIKAMGNVTNAIPVSNNYYHFFCIIQILFCSLQCPLHDRYYLDSYFRLYPTPYLNLPPNRHFSLIK